MGKKSGIIGTSHLFLFTVFLNVETVGNRWIFVSRGSLWKFPTHSFNYFPFLFKVGSNTTIIIRVILGEEVLEI